MKFNRNKFLARFTEDGLCAPPEWASKQAERLYDAGVETEQNGAWTNHVLGSICVAVSPTRPEFVAYGTHPDAARAHVENYIAKKRAELIMMEKTLENYGPAAFIEKPAAVECPAQPAPAEPFLRSILHRDWTNIWINGVEFRRDASRAAARVEAA